MQALDDEEVQMQGLTFKIKELEKVVEQKNLDLENLEASRGKVMKKLSVTVSKFDELHHLSANLLAEVEKLQSQLQDRDAEISFLRQEVTRCTNDVLVASQTSNKRNSDEIHELLTWFDMNIARVVVHNAYLREKNNDNDSEHKEIFKKKIDCIISELEDLQAVAQSKDTLLQVERSKVEELTRKGESLEKSLHEKESQLNLLEGVGDSGRGTSMTSEIIEVEPAVRCYMFICLLTCISRPLSEYCNVINDFKFVDFFNRKTTGRYLGPPLHLKSAVCAKAIVTKLQLR